MVSSQIGPPKKQEVIGVEVAWGVLVNYYDAYNNRLESFGYEEPLLTSNLHGRLVGGVSWQILDALALLVSFSNLDSAQYDGPRGQFGWAAYCLGFHARGLLKVREWFSVYAQVGAGPGMGVTDYSDDNTSHYEERNYGIHLSGELGLRFMPWRHFGFFVQFGYIRAPIIRNEMDERHNSGGPLFAVGLRVAK